jgi:hypothetical protein
MTKIFYFSLFIYLFSTTHYQTSPGTKGVAKLNPRNVRLALKDRDLV